SVIIFSAIGLTAFAFVSVVLMRPCSVSDAVRFAYRALRWAESRPSFLPERWCLIAAPLGGKLLPAQRQPVLGQGLLDLLDRLLAEVRDRSELRLRLGDEIADRLDAHALEAVVRADSELELLDREVLHPVRERRLGGLLGGGLREALDLLDVREDRELADQQLGGLRDRVARVERAVCRHVEDELVVVRPLADAGSLDVVRHAAHRREDRVDR